jgi:DNA-binding NarL/FixJ family response regulator
LRSRELGLTAGLTYSIPRHTDAFRSGFGLAAPKGVSQEHCDQIWKENADEIIQVMSIFDLSVGDYPNIPEGQQLDEKTLSFMRLVAEGRSMNEIADLKGCHFRTVDNRLAKARDILGAVNTLQAVLIAKEQGQL